MALVARVAAVLPLAGAVAAAAALTGVAVFTVTGASCASPGHYVEHDGVVELVGGCLDTHRLPAAPGQPPHDAAPAKQQENAQFQAQQRQP